MENRKLDFIGEVLCPMKAAFNEGYQAVAAEHTKKTGEKWFGYVPTVCGGDAEEEEAEKLAEELSSIDPKTFPDVVASFGFGDYFHSAFCRHMLGKGCFETLGWEKRNVAFENIGIEDPGDEINVLAAYPMVFLVDKRKLGSLPAPRTWADLLEPKYKGQITMSGSHGRPSTTLLMYLYKEFGEDGLSRFESNVTRAVHPSEMAKIAGTLRSEATGIYTIMNFFGRARGDSEYTELVWPEDGAIFDPAYILIKKGMKEKYTPLIEYVAGQGFGQQYADNGFPSACPNVDNKLGEGQKLKWIGWDFLRKNRIEEIEEALKQRFVKFMA